MGTQLQMIYISFRTLQLPFVINRNIPWQKKEQILISLGIEVIIKIFIFLATNKTGSLKSFDTGIINSFLHMNLDYDSLKILQTELAVGICWCFLYSSTEEHATSKHNWHLIQCVHIVQERQNLFKPQVCIYSDAHKPLRRFHSASSFILQSKIILALGILLVHCWLPIVKEKINQGRSAKPDPSLYFISQLGINFSIYMYTCAIDKFNW